MRWFVPRMGRVSQEQADARSTMTGRIVDSYTNIATVKLFSHSRREQAYAREAMDGFLGTVYRQMRLATITYSLLYALNMALVAAVAALGLWLRSEEHTSELQSLMRITYAVFCLKKKTNINTKYL